jgi:hypothetical protein
MMAESANIDPAKPGQVRGPQPVEDTATQPSAHSGRQHPTNNPVLVSFSRHAPTFEGEEKTVQVQKMQGGITAGFGGIEASVDISTTKEITVRTTQCKRYTSILFKHSDSAGDTSHGASSSTPQGQDVENPHKHVPPSPIPKDTVAYLVLGIFSAVDGQPAEKVILIRKKNAHRLFINVRLATLQLRGARYFFSLKSVKAFRVYRCVTSTGSHEQLEIDGAGLADLRQFKAAYKKQPWPAAIVNTKWTEWVFDYLNNKSLDVMDEAAYSLEIVLGWSPTRIAIAVLSPVALSLAVGFWLNSGDWSDLATIQTAWGVASYIVTAGGCKWAVFKARR